MTDDDAATGHVIPLTDAELESAVEDCAYYLDGANVKLRVEKLVSEIRRLRADRAVLLDLCEKHHQHTARTLALVEELAQSMKGEKEDS